MKTRELYVTETYITYVPPQDRSFTNKMRVVMNERAGDALKKPPKMLRN